MGFWVMCRCDNCGMAENVEINNEGKDSYSIDSGDEAGAEFTTFGDLTHYTDLGFRMTFVGVDKHNPDDYKLLCRSCREEVRQVDKILAIDRQKMIATALKGSLEEMCRNE